MLTTLLKSGTGRWPLVLIALTVALLIAVVLAPGLLHRLPNASPRLRHRVAWGTFFSLFITILWTDWPGVNVHPRWSDFWASHALLAGTFTSVVLLGAGLLLFDVETESLRRTRRLAVARSIFANVEFEFRRLVIATEDLQMSKAKNPQGANRVDELGEAINRFNQEVRNAQLLSLGLGGDEGTRLAELLLRLSARSFFLTHALHHFGEGALEGEDSVWLGRVYWNAISDIGGILELLRYAVGAPVDAAVSRKILGESAGTLTDIEVVRLWGTLREGLGAHPGTGTPPEERPVNLFFGQNDPTQFEWSELLDERSRVSRLIADGRVQAQDDTATAEDMYPGGGGRHPRILPIKRSIGD